MVRVGRHVPPASAVALYVVVHHHDDEAAEVEPAAVDLVGECGVRGHRRTAPGTAQQEAPAPRGRGGDPFCDVGGECAAERGRIRETADFG
jgi:hypothetical protein